MLSIVSTLITVSLNTLTVLSFLYCTSVHVLCIDGDRLVKGAMPAESSSQATLRERQQFDASRVSF